MKKILLIIASIIILLIIVGTIIMNNFNRNYTKAMNELVIGNIDLTKVADGEYEGNYSIFPIIVEVKVRVLDHKIMDIDIVKHQTGQGQGAEVIVDSVIEKQSLQVDTISKATGSSKVILKAIEDALK